MKLTRLIPMILVALCIVAGASAAIAQDRASLSKGEIHVATEDVAGSDVPSMTMTAVIDAPPQKVWEIVSDCDKYESRMPNINEARELKREGNKVFCEVEVDLPFPLSNLTAVTEAVHKTSSKKWSRTWTLVRGDYSVNNGSWVLSPFEDDAKRTLAVYTVHADPDTFVPDWAREKAQKSSFPDLMERLRKEVKKL
ncbi:MAG: SRPBCC family protein [Persicimonas sp.]